MTRDCSTFLLAGWKPPWTRATCLGTGVSPGWEGRLVKAEDPGTDTQSICWFRFYFFALFLVVSFRLSSWKWGLLMGHFLLLLLFFFSLFLCFHFLSPMSGCRTYLAYFRFPWHVEIRFVIHFISLLLLSTSLYIILSLYYLSIYMRILSISLSLFHQFSTYRSLLSFHLPVPSNHHLNHSPSLPYLSISLHLFFHPSFSPSFLHPRFTLTGGSAGNEPVAHLIAMFLAWLSAIDCGVGNGVWRYCNCCRLCVIGRYCLYIF